MSRQYWTVCAILSVTFYACVQYVSHFSETSNIKPHAPSMKRHDIMTARGQILHRSDPFMTGESRLLFSAPQKCAGRTVFELVEYIRNMTGSSVTREAIMNLDNLAKGKNFGSVVTRVVRESVNASKPPSFTYTHFSYIDFSGESAHPLYFSLVRDPFERVRSFYYFRRYGDSMAETEQSREWRKRIAELNLTNESFDECVRLRRPECVGQRSESDLIRQFCGYGPECYGDPEDVLELAKRNIDRQYYVVGITEEFEDFVKILEIFFPVHFNDAMKHYKSSAFTRIVSTTKTNLKLPTTQKTRAIMMPILKYEYALYAYVKRRFHQLKEHLQLG